MTITPELTIKVGRKHYAVADYAQASAMFCAARDKSGLGASRLPNALIFSGQEQVAYVSYNGKVWPGTTYQPDATPLFNPY